MLYAYIHLKNYCSHEFTWRTPQIQITFLQACEPPVRGAYEIHLYKGTCEFWCRGDVIQTNLWSKCFVCGHVMSHAYVRVVLNSFIWKTPSSPKIFFLSPNFRELHVYLSRYMLAKIFKKNMDVWYPQIVPGVWSLVTLHSAAAALKHLRSALRCWSLAHLHRPVLTQQVHSLGHLAFEGRPSFAKALAKLSPNFREKSPNSFYNMKH